MDALDEVNLAFDKSMRYIMSNENNITKTENNKEF